MPDISPAQRIVAAFNERYELCGPFDDDWIEQCLAAALGAAADQVVPHATTIARTDRGANRRKIRSELLAIATELKTTTTTDTP
jgi:hypothetical protein